MNLTGRYSVTFSADPACDLPELRSRTYSADITPLDSEYLAALQGGVFEPDFDRFFIAVFEDVVLVEIHNGYGGAIKETAPGNIPVELRGGGTGAASRDAFELKWKGSYSYGPYGCPSDGHRVAFTRIG